VTAVEMWNGDLLLSVPACTVLNPVTPIWICGNTVNIAPRQYGHESSNINQLGNTPVPL